MEDEKKKGLRAQTFGYISAALGLVAGLAWNDAIANLINKLFPLAKDTVAMKFVYAIVVTVAVVLLIQYINRFIEKS